MYYEVFVREQHEDSPTSTLLRLRYVVGLLCLADAHLLFSVYSHITQGELALALFVSTHCPTEPILAPL